MLSVVVPTYNEVVSLPLLAERLHAAMAISGINYELVVVDDNSPDGTGATADELGKRFPLKVLHRSGKNGLASAVLEGFGLASGTLLAVMDADLSHPPEVMPRLVQALRDAGADLAVGSRYVPGGGTEDWPKKRYYVSVFANQLTRRLTPVRDATSGFFVIRRSALEGVTLNPIGFKIGLEVIARARYGSVVEVPYVFTDRKHGASKFGSPEVRAYLRQLAILYWERVRRLRYEHKGSEDGRGVAPAAQPAAVRDPAPEGH